jgi:aryl-alcohol dehydrogenase-like predicted oxidoreductase
MTTGAGARTLLSRRSFVGSGVAATLGAAAGATAASGGGEAPAEGKGAPYNPRTSDAMPTRNLGRTGYQVGIFSLGGQAKLERTFAADESVEIVNRAIDLGINYIDSAAAYGKDENWESVHGTSERNIGQVMKQRRSEVFLASKTHERGYDGSMRLLESSLENLQTDHLDLWQLHNIKRQDDLNRIFARDGAIKALEKARSEGMVRHLGITGHFEPLILAQALERYDFDTILMVVSAADPNYLSFKDHLLPVALAKGVGIIAMKLAARGRLISEWTPPPLEKQQEYMRTSLPGTITMKESLHYTCTQPVSTCIVGCDTIAQLEENVSIATNFEPMDEAKMAKISGMTASYAAEGSFFKKDGAGFGRGGGDDQDTDD